MAEQNLPYVVSTGSLVKVLEKIQTAATPDRFTQDFLATTLGMKGGGPKAVIPFLKRTGFLASDGAPTDLYKRFRNGQLRGAAAAAALRQGYEPLFQANEQSHELSDDELRGLMIQTTGAEEGSRALSAMMSSFKALRDHADFRATVDVAEDSAEVPVEEEQRPCEDIRPPVVDGLNIGYTINLHLPPTSDIAVFNAIFKSLRENLLR